MRVCQCSSWLWLSLLSFWPTPTPLPSLSLSFCPESLFSRLFLALKDQILIKVIQWFWMTNDLLSGIVLQITGKRPSLPLFINTLIFFILPALPRLFLPQNNTRTENLLEIHFSSVQRAQRGLWMKMHLHRPSWKIWPWSDRVSNPIFCKENASPIGLLAPKVVSREFLSIIGWQVSDADQVSRYPSVLHG